LKARITIFNLNGKASIWWEDLGNVKGFHEKDLSWKQFDKYLRKKYMSDKYMDGKNKEFYELRCWAPTTPLIFLQNLKSPY
jgi:hypothetical protein